MVKNPSTQRHGGFRHGRSSTQKKKRRGPCINDIGHDITGPLPKVFESRGAHELGMMGENDKRMTNKLVVR